MVKPLTLLPDFGPPESFSPLRPLNASLFQASWNSVFSPPLLEPHTRKNYRTLASSAGNRPSCRVSLYPYRLTAFVTKCFGQAQEFIFIDDKNIQDALEWMAGNQLPSGCYANVGKLIHTAMKVRLSHHCVWRNLDL